MRLEIAKTVDVTLTACAKGRHFLVDDGSELVELDEMPPCRLQRKS